QELGVGVGGVVGDVGGTGGWIEVIAVPITCVVEESDISRILFDSFKVGVHDKGVAADSEVVVNRTPDVIPVVKCAVGAGAKAGERKVESRRKLAQGADSVTWEFRLVRKIEGRTRPDCQRDTRVGGSCAPAVGKDCCDKSLPCLECRNCL